MVYVLLECHPGLLQVGQGHPGFAQLLAQGRHGGVDLQRLSFQAASTSPSENTEDRDGEGCVFSVCGPELGRVPAELHVGSEGAKVKPGLGHSQRSLFVVDGLLQSHHVFLQGSNLLQSL